MREEREKKYCGKMRMRHLLFMLESVGVWEKQEKKNMKFLLHFKLLIFCVIHLIEWAKI